ncbi:metallophosphoesterase [Oxalobacteraceae sp. CFBP 13730]|nr:metallophosphoesterase [Oxalobacteraceae sp. CFBP 13730]
MRIVHLSDLHLSNASISDQSIVLKALFADLRRLSEESPIDIVVFTGDLVAKGEFSTETLALVRDTFVIPVGHAANISPSRFFLVPGNHDVNQKKRTNLLNPVIEACTSKDKVNNLLDQMDDHEQLLSQMKDFNEIFTSLMQSTPTYSDALCRTYTVNVNGIEVGVACLNSAWKSSGQSGDKDYGNLLVGERQVEKAANSLSHCQIKLALIHHPLDWLTTFDKPSVMKLIYSKFDALLHGHNHTSDAISVASSTATTFISNAGCLYQHRDYFNGFSVLDVFSNSNGLVWTVKAREYYDNRREFDIAPRFAENGTKQYIVLKSNSLSIVVPSQLYLEAVDEKVNSKLLSYVASDSAPKSIQQIFVDPALSYVSESKVGGLKNDEDLKYMTLQEITASNKTLLFLGKKESGRTTILSYLCTKANDPTYFLSSSHGFYVDLSVLPRPTRAAILEAMVMFCAAEYKRSEIIELLNSGRAVVCFDNMPLNNPSLHREIESFLNQNKNNKFIISAEERFEESVALDSMRKLGIPCDVIFVHSFSRRQVRELVTRWLPEDPDVQQQTNKILQSVRKLGVPSTPFLISIFLWIRERNVHFSPINHAAIIDAFIDGLLEKLNEAKDRSSTDSTIKRDFLSQLAYRMHAENSTVWSVHEVEKFTVNYFDERSLSTSSHVFLSELYTKGILLKLGDEVSFKFDCFRSFFLAHVISTSIEFRSYALTETGFLDLQSEIDFYTGLHRNQKDFLIAAELIVDNLRSGLGVEAKHADFVEIDNNGSILQGPEEKDVVSALFGTSPTIAEQEQVLDELDRRSTSLVTLDKKNKPAEIEVSELQPFANYMDALKLAGAVLRNSELVNDVDIKNRLYCKFIENWADVLIWLLATIDNASDSQIDKLAELLPSGGTIDPCWLAKVAFPNVIFGSLHESLGTAKLERVISRQLDCSELELVTRLLSTILYVDLTLYEYLNKLEELLSHAQSHRLTKDIVFLKLLELFHFKRLSPGESQRVAKLAARIYAELNAGKSGREQTMLKDAFVKKLSVPKISPK